MRATASDSCDSNTQTAETQVLLDSARLFSPKEKPNYAFGRVHQLAEWSGFFCLEHKKRKDTTNIRVDGKIDCIPPSIASLCGCQLSFSLVGATFCIIRGEKNCEFVFGTRSTSAQEEVVLVLLLLVVQQVMIIVVILVSREVWNY